MLNAKFCFNYNIPRNKFLFSLQNRLPIRYSISGHVASSIDRRSIRILMKKMLHVFCRVMNREYKILIIKSNGIFDRTLETVSKSLHQKKSFSQRDGTQIKYERQKLRNTHVPSRYTTIQFITHGL